MACLPEPVLLIPPLNTSLAINTVVPVQSAKDAAPATVAALAAAQMAPRQNSRRAMKAAMAMKPAKENRVLRISTAREAKGWEAGYLLVPVVELWRTDEGCRM